MFLLLLALQAEESVLKAHREVYQTAVNDCEKAAGLVDSDPDQAVTILTRILDDARIRKRECRLRIELHQTEWSKWHDFFPYQLRGRARMRLSEKASDRAQREKLLRAAVDDLEESARKRKLASSRPYLEAARAALKKLLESTPKEDPRLAFRKEWEGYLQEGRFDDAKSHVTRRGTFLSSQERKRYVEETEAACRKHFDKACGVFLAALEKAPHPASLRPVDLVLPERTHLIVVHPAYEWCAGLRSMLQSRDYGLDRLERAARDALPLGEAWSVAAARLFRARVREEIERRVGLAADAPGARREVLRAEAEGILKKWKDLAGKLPARARGEDPASLLAGFPVESADLARLLAALRQTVTAADPHRALADLEAEIEKARTSAARLAIESRRDLLRLQIVAAASRGFLAGKTEAEMARQLYIHARPYRDLGGSFDVKDLGPRIRRLFERLR